jgi:hypothetical protein
MMDKVQKHNLFNTNTPSSESYKNYILSQYLLEEWSETTQKLTQDNHSPGQDSNPGPPEYKAGMPTTVP